MTGDGADPDATSGRAGGRWPIRGWTVLRDLLLVAAWVAAVSIAWGAFGWPPWAYYPVVFGGIVGYALTGDPW